MVPKIARWQQVLLLAGALLAIGTSLSLRRAGSPLPENLAPLILPALLWWPRPRGFYKRLYWWQMVLLLIGVEIGLLLVSMPRFLS